MDRISSSCSVRDSRQWYNNSGNIIKGLINMFTGSKAGNIR